MEVAPNVHQVTVGERMSVGVDAPNVYLVTGMGMAAFVDTAYGRDDEVSAHLKLWETQGKPDIAGIVLTHRHRDHIGGAARLHEATGGQIVCGIEEKESIELVLGGLRVGRSVASGDTLDLNGATLEFIRTPGHTLGSLCVLYREQGVLFTGDTILGAGTTSISPDHGDMGMYIESLRDLYEYDARMICPGHGPAVERPKAKIEQLIKHRLYRERQILGLLEGGHGTIDELFGAIYSKLDSRLHDAARGQIRAHLIKLVREEEVAEVEDGGYGLTYGE